MTVIVTEEEVISVKIGGAIKKLTYGAVGAGLGGIKGVAKGVVDSSRVASNTTAEFNDKVSLTNSSDKSAIGKTAKNAASLVTGLGKTAWYGLVNVVGHTVYGAATGWAVGDAMARGNTTVIAGPNMQLTSGNGVFTDISMERGKYGEATSTNLDVQFFKKPPNGDSGVRRGSGMKVVAADRNTGMNVVGKENGNGPLLLMS